MNMIKRLPSVNYFEISHLNVTVIVPYRGGRRYVDAGEDTLLLGKVVLVA